MTGAEPPSVEQLLASQLEVAEAQLRWLQAAALPQVRATVASTLNSSRLRKAYELCDGTKKSNEVAAEVGISKQALSAWTRRWRNLGIAYEVEGRRIHHLISLAALELPLEVAADSATGG
jgi:hypothetical protein